MDNVLRRRMMISAVLVLALVAAARAAEEKSGTAAPAAEKDKTPVERIVAVGDVHGDYDQFVKVLRAAEVIDKDHKWIAGKTHLVQTGDVLDRGPDSRKAMDLLMSLEKQAADAGGAVHALIGNHEAMVILGDWRYVNPEEEKAFGGKEEYRKAMSAEGQYGKWIRSHDAVVQVNDVLFAHAGVRAADADKPLKEINEAVRKQLTDGAEDGLASDPEGPLWNRFLATDEEDKVAKELDTVLKKYGAAHMVVGHTVGTKGLELRAGGRLIRIDVGMSKYYGGPAACLLIDKGVFYEVRDGKPRRKLGIKAPAAPAQPQEAPAPQPQEAPAPSRKAA